MQIELEKQSDLSFAAFSSIIAIKQHEDKTVNRLLSSRIEIFQVSFSDVTSIAGVRRNL